MFLIGGKFKFEHFNFNRNFKTILFREGHLFTNIRTKKTRGDVSLSDATSRRESNVKLIKLITTFQWQFPTKRSEHDAYVCRIRVRTYVRFSAANTFLEQVAQPFELSCSRALPTAKMQRKISGRCDYLDKFKSV